MTDNLFIAELHDIGKLVDKNNTNKMIKGHTFTDFDFSKADYSKPTASS